MIVSAGIITVTAAVFLAPQCARLRHLQQVESKLRAENQASDAAVRKLRHRQDQFVTNASFVERVARNEGMVKPDEIVFKFIPDESNRVATQRDK